MEDNREVLAPVQMFQNESLEPDVSRVEPGDLIYFIEKLSVMVAKHGYSVSTTGWIVGFQCAECGSVFVSYKNLKLHEIECTHTATFESDPPQTLATNKQFEVSQVSMSSFERQQPHIDAEYENVNGKGNTHSLAKSSKRSSPDCEMHCCSKCGKQFESLSCKSQHENVYPESPQLHESVDKENIESNESVNEDSLTPEIDEIFSYGQKTFPESSRLQQVGSYRKNKYFACVYCSKQFEWKASAMRHEKKCDKSVENEMANTPDNADIESNNSSEKQDLSEDEMDTPLLDNDDEERYHARYDCPICGKRFRGQTKLDQHQVRHTGERPFECELCGQRFAWIYTRSLHKLTCTGVGDWQDFDFENVVPLFDGGVFNKRSHTYVCTHCNKHFAAVNWLRKHCSEQHEEIKCDTLETFADWSQRVKQEMMVNSQLEEDNSVKDKLIHTERLDTENEQEDQQPSVSPANAAELRYQGKFDCEVCHQVFSKERLFKKHILIHRKEKTFCNLCGKRFSVEQFHTHHKLVCKSKINKLNRDGTCGEKVNTKSRSRSYAEGRVQCKKCKRHFSSPTMLRHHSVVHMKEKRFNCRFCWRSYYIKNKWRTHQNLCKLNRGSKKESKTKIRCSFCKESFHSEKDVSKHACSSDRSKAIVEYVCTICNQKYTYKNNIIAHMKKHSSTNLRPCNKCGKFFSLQGSYQNHIKWCNIAKDERHMYNCSMCPKSFTRRPYLVDHERRHRGELLFKCDVCDKSYTNNHTLKMHQTAVHSGLKPFMCNECGKCFPMRSNLNVHLKIHEGKKDHKCDICGRGFIFKGHLNAHKKKVHSEVRDFQCCQCPKSFKTMSDLKSHEFTHTGIRPYKCTLCPMAFKTRKALRYHEGTHTGSTKRYECSVCYKTFTIRASMLKHKESHFTDTVSEVSQPSNQAHDVGFMSKDDFLLNFPFGTF